MFEFSHSTTTILIPHTIESDKYIISSGIILQPLNSEYAPMVFTNEQIETLPVRVIGIVEERKGENRYE